MKTPAKKRHQRALQAPPGAVELAKRLPAPAPAAAAAPVAPPAPPKALTLETRAQIQSVLNVAEKTLGALRANGQFGLLGLVAQLAHALKLVGEHSHALERALALEAEKPAPAPSTSNGVHPS